MHTGSILLSWYKLHKRDLPWRKTSNPYFIWISEVILQQTRVDQGTVYYLKFIQQYPTIKKLAAAPESEVLKTWQGLGYYSRARNMHAAAKEIVHKHKEVFPDTYEEIRALRGVGDYTAAAISSFAFQLKYPVVDGNVFRFLSRYFGIRTPVGSSSTKKEFQAIALKLLGKHSPHDFNQAIMEFGALQCKPLSPDCPSCPLHSSCYAFENNEVRLFPVKTKKPTTRSRYFYYLVVRENKSFYLQQRKEKDIWQNLYEFPLIEVKKKLKFFNLPGGPEWKTVFRASPISINRISPERKHILSHQVIHTKFIEITVNDKKFIKPATWKKVSPAQVKKYAVPRLIEKYLQEQE